MLINYVPGEECRIAIVRDEKLDEFYQERASSESHVGNIYKGKVTNVEPSIQAAFIDFGLGQNGFLHVTDLHPMYFPGNGNEKQASLEQVGSKTPHRERPPIQKALRRGQELLVQVLKEGIGTKGPTLTSYLSIPGRFLVMMPHMEHMGVSRKVEDEDTRREMRRILEELDPPRDFGFIVRTAGFSQTKTDLKRDLAYLQRLWKTIEKRRKQSRGPGELYAESDLIIRTIRDVFSTHIERIVVDDLTAARRARDFLAIANPRAKSRVVYYDDPVPLFHRFKIEQQIENINSHTVPLPSGGSLVIEQTEALVAIDVNSGKSKEARDAETNAYNTNREAVDEICRQLRLRDLGGVVVNDLIDMRSRKHRRDIEQRFRENLKHDRARTRTGSISQFGIVEMTRQRMRPSLKNSIYMDCPSCGAPGHVKTPESVVLDVMRRLALVMHREEVTRIELTISPDVAFHLLNRKRAMLVKLEQRFGKSAVVRVGGHSLDHLQIQAFDKMSNPLGSDADFMANRITAEQASTYRDLDDPALPKIPEAVDSLAATDVAPETEVASVEKTEVETALEAAGDGQQADSASSEGEDGQSGKRRRRRRGGRSRRKKQAASSAETTGEADEADGSAPPTEPAEAAEASEPASATGAAADTEPSTTDAGETNGDSQSASGGRKRRGGRRRGGRRRRSSPRDGETQAVADSETTGEAVEASTEAVESAEAGGAPATSEDEQLALPEESAHTERAETASTADEAEAAANVEAKAAVEPTDRAEPAPAQPDAPRGKKTTSSSRSKTARRSKRATPSKKTGQHKKASQRSSSDQSETNSEDRSQRATKKTGRSKKTTAPSASPEPASAEASDDQSDDGGSPGRNDAERPTAGRSSAGYSNKMLGGDEEGR